MNGRQPKPVPGRETPTPRCAAMFYSSVAWAGSPGLDASQRDDGRVLAIQDRDGRLRSAEFDSHGRELGAAFHASLDDARDWCAERIPEQSEEAAREWLRDEAHRAGRAWVNGRNADLDYAWQARERAAGRSTR
jgi:hypothetical protein